MQESIMIAAFRVPAPEIAAVANYSLRGVLAARLNGRVSDTSGQSESDCCPTSDKKHLLALS